MNYELKEGPQTRMAPEHKPINPDKIPKRPEEKGFDFLTMTNEQLLSVMAVAYFRTPYDKIKYLADNKYKAEVDWILHTGDMAHAMLFFRDNDINVENIIKKAPPIIKPSFLRV